MLTQFLDGVSYISDKKNAYSYHTAQVAIISAISYLSSYLVSHLTHVSPCIGVVFMLSAYVVHKIAKEQLKPCFVDYAKKQNQPFAYKVAKWTIALLAAKAICAICGTALGFGQIALLCGAFYLGYCISVIALAKLTDLERVQKRKQSIVKEPHARTT